MRTLVGFCVMCAACGGSSAGSADAPGSADAAREVDAASTDAPVAPLCVTPSGAAPRNIALSGSGTLGVFDSSFAHDPATDRTWMTYSSVASGPDQLRLVSTRLAYTDDGGASFCEAGVINPSTSTTPPSELAGDAAFWNHEVSSLAYDAAAPADERWRLVWFRYLIADTGPGAGGQFQYSWISERFAASPDQLAAAPEHKLVAGADYAIDASVQSFNDAVIGPPELRIDQLDASLADCIAVTEPGALARTADRWLALNCSTTTASASRIVLLADDRAGHWSLVARLLGAAEAAAFHADNFSAASLFDAGSGAVGLIATPTAGDAYAGCVGYSLDGSGAVSASPTFGISLPSGANFGGACGYDPALTASGVVFAALDTTASPLDFRLLATGVFP